MRLFTNKGAVTAFYYLMAADDEIGPAEREKLRMIAGAFIPADAERCLQEIERSYEALRAEDPEDDEDEEAGGFYDRLTFEVDEALAAAPRPGEPGVSPRLLLWDLLVIAATDGRYDTQEQWLARHVARLAGVEKRALVEMERLIRADAALEARLSCPGDPAARAALEEQRQALRREAEALLSEEIGRPFSPEGPTGLFIVPRSAGGGEDRGPRYPGETR